MAARLLAFALLAATFLAAIGAGSAQAAPALAFVAPTTEPVRVELTTHDGRTSGQLAVALLNSSATTKLVDLAFIATGTTPATGVQVTTAAPVTAVTFAITPLIAQFTVSGSAPTKAIDGVLVASLRGATDVSPASLKLTLVPTPEATPGVIEPSALTLTATCLVPGPLKLLAGCLALPEPKPRILLRGATKLPAEPLSTTLASDTSATAPVSLRFTSDADQSVGNIALGSIPRVGKYAGTLLADPTDDKSPQVALTLNVQDFVFWPLLVVGLGVATASVPLSWRDRDRNRELLRKALKDIQKQYHDERQHNTASWVEPYNYEHTIPANFPDEQTCKATPQQATLAAQLYCDIAAAKTATDLSDITKQVTDLGSRVAFWQPTCEAAGSLREDLTGDKLPTDWAIAAATEKLLTRQDKPPGNATRAAELLEQLRQQRQALEIITRGRALLTRAQPLYSALLQRKQHFATDDERTELIKHDPAALATVYLQPAESLEVITQSGVIARLQESLVFLLALNTAYPAPTTTKMLPDWDALSAAAPLRELLSALGSASQPTYDTRTPEEILKLIQEHDRREFFATALITSLVFVLGLYSGKNFGTWEQYLGAFCAGTAGTVAINWALLPWYRSYQVKADDTKKAAA